jgi:hypothetical protein
MKARSVAIAMITLVVVIASAAADTGADYSVLLVGNSHSSRGNLPLLLEQLLEAGDDDVTANVQAERHWAFLAERLQGKATQKALESRPWTHIVLQAQKYSTTGKYTYPTDAAQEWIRRSRRVGAQPILFPEWARRDHLEEGARIHRLHVQIASLEPACVAPVGLAWEIMHNTNPDITLHERDGNHANRNGALLTAFVLYATITGKRVQELPLTKPGGVSEKTQTLLRAAADLAVSLAPPCN